ncbi:MerR family transcriptional regulator [Micromonospora sp. NPDC000207]|uniref:MerR family transcriptional regulator n=1 Tax=Micromonospora sp. NPDC000207 TaxID=3154246 RepID=UPI00332AD233
MTASLPPAQAAERTGLTLDTLRYYEREGLIGPVDRTSGGKRRYSDDDVFWIGLISCLRDAGLGIADLRQFTSMLREGDAAGDRVGFLTRHRSELQRRAAQIETAISVLDEKIAYYSATD